MKCRFLYNYGYSLLIVFVLCDSSQILCQTNHWETIVYDSSYWQYNVPDANVSSSWILPGFDATGWPVSKGGFGYGDGDDSTILPDGTITVYQRILFDVNDTSFISKMILNIDYDDGFVAYLNGIEIARNGFATLGQPPYNLAASISHEAVLFQGLSPEEFIFSPNELSALIHNGQNLLCVEVHNNDASSSDFTSRVFLSVGIKNTQVQYGPTPSWFNPPFEFFQSNLPIIIINTNGSTIQDDPKVDAVMGIVNNGPNILNHINDSTNEFYGDIAIEVRGSSSQSFPMQSYGLETRGPTPDINYNVSLFDWPADNDWILYAPYTDKTLIRNVLTFDLGNKMGRYAPRTQLCELVINGDYRGVYVLMERIKQNPGRVNIDELHYEDTTDNELSGGYIIKLDKTTGNGQIAWTSPYLSAAPSTTMISYQLHDPDYSALHPYQRVFIENYVTNWENALAGSDFTNPQLGYRAFIDETSFIDFLLITELSKNVDGYRLSTFLHKQRVSEGGKLVAGPLWDFNLAWGNSDYCQGSSTSGWEINFNSLCGGGFDNPFWWSRLLEDPQFANQVNCRWKELRTTIFKTSTLLNFIDSLANKLKEPAARNYEKWPILGTYVWPNNFVGNTYLEEVEYMKNWILARITWLDANMFGNCQNAGNLNQKKPESQIEIFPNPSNGFVLLRSSKTINKANISIKNAIGQEIKRYYFENLTELQLELNTFSSGFYLIEIQSDNQYIEILKIQIK